MTQFVTIDRATLEQLVAALEDSIDCVRHEYETYWGHGLPTRKAQIDSMKESLDQHESAITAGRAALANAEPTGWIAAKDRMPPPQVRVLGFEPQYNIVDVDMWFGPDFNWGYSYWMPLPTPPKDAP